MDHRSLVLVRCLHDAGVLGLIREIPNRYWPDHPICDDVRSPWLEIDAPRGTIVFGSRKRVIHIEWSGDFPSGGDVVAKPGNTHGPEMCHAYGIDEARDCLRRLVRLSAPGKAD